MKRQISSKSASCILATLISVVSFGASAANTSSNVQERAIDTLSQSHSIDKKDIKVVSSESVQWPDTSLGCPKVGLMYPQVLTPGHKVVLKSGNTTHAVHMSKVRAIVCEASASSESANKTSEKGKMMKLGELRIDKLSRDAKHDLASKIGVAEKDISLRSAKSVNWPDTSLGCGKKGQKYKEEKTRGYRLIFRAKGKDYTYHTDQDQRVIACPEIAAM